MLIEKKTRRSSAATCNKIKVQFHDKLSTHTLFVVDTTVTAPVPPGVRSSTFCSLLCRTPSAFCTTVCFVVVFTIFGARVDEGPVVDAGAAFPVIFWPAFSFATEDQKMKSTLHKHQNRGIQPRLTLARSSAFIISSVWGCLCSSTDSSKLELSSLPLPLPLAKGRSLL